MTAPRRMCPGCQSALQVFHAHDATRGAGNAPVEIDRCFFCGGFWFDAGELERVTGRALRPEFLEGTTGRACAACGVTLAPAVLREIPADVCPGCQSAFVGAEGLERLAGREVALRRPADDPMSKRANVALTFKCPGCGDERPYDEGMTTRSGLACPACFGALDATPSTLPAYDRPLLRGVTIGNAVTGGWGGWGYLLWKIFDD